MDSLAIYAPSVLYIITTLIGLKIFARRDELTELETKLITYINASFVSKESIQDIKDQIREVKEEVREIRNLLIGGKLKD